MNTEHPLLVALVGPTAVGKTALSLELAEALSGEIVSADSRLVYRGMDIGTAKPTAQEQARIPHHLIDIIDPADDYSLATYQTAVYAAIDAIVARGRRPLLVGGTGQYLAAVLEGWQIPHVPPQPELRNALLAQAERDGSAGLHQKLAQADPEAAAAIDSSNVRRVIRALEVFHVTGQPMSVLQTRQPPPYRTITLDLERPRPELYARIDERVGAMVHSGLIAEVLGLIRSGYSWELPAMSSLGYREFAGLWAGTATAADCISQLKFNTHRFARKQGAWFRRLPNRHVLPAGADNLLEQAIAATGSSSGPE
ncbi:MAG: tRNA (adenosine(37)-N6)-dimethylallyltransferase MiaA [Herpetosiphonaceae bacterium]|nr:tRNA (adenosine(37)-N6)-dimethylallyltransferase MiaA [Herpetosiphonaceae bacterium]